MKTQHTISSQLKKITPNFESKKYLLAVSGGIDSMVMLDCFSKLNLSFEVAHYNFQLRGEESNKDEALVREICNKEGVPFNVNTTDTNTFAKENKLSIQEAARKLRYDWFFELIALKKFDFIVTAHHADDNIETFFINLLRGGGIKGLCGIKNTEHIIRPLLLISKTEIEDYAKDNDIKYRNDSSNESLKYKRNFIRKKVVPELNNVQENASKSILKSISHLNQANDYLAKKIQQDIEKFTRKEENSIFIDISKPIESIVLFTALNEYGFNTSQVEDIQNSNNSVGKTFHSKTHKLLIDRNQIIIQEFAQKEIKTIEIPNLGNFEVPFSISFTEKEPPKSFKSDKNTIFLDLEKIKFPLQLRKWQEGDWFIPLGMKGKKKLSDFFIDQKLSLFEKENTWLLTNNQDIIWVVNQQLDDRYKISNSTKKIIKVVTNK